MLMAEDASRNLIPDQLKPLTGVAQRSGAKSGAKRFDLSSNQNASAGNQADPHNLHSKSSFPSLPNKPLNSRNIREKECLEAIVLSLTAGSNLVQTDTDDRRSHVDLYSR